MKLSDLKKKIESLATANAKVENTIQTLGMACIEHLATGNRDPLNMLYGALRRTQYRAFAEWALAFGMCKKNTDKATMKDVPFLYDKTKGTDLPGAAAKPWFMFAEPKEEATAKAFDFQAAVMALLKRAATQGHNHAELVEVAKAAGIKPEKVPATIKTAEQVAAEVGEAII